MRCEPHSGPIVSPVCHLSAEREAVPTSSGPACCPHLTSRSMQGINEHYQRWVFFPFKECLHPSRWPQLSFMNELDWPSGWASGGPEPLCIERCNLSALPPPMCSSVCLHVKCFTRPKIKAMASYQLDSTALSQRRTPPPQTPPLAGCISWWNVTFCKFKINGTCIFCSSSI